MILKCKKCGHDKFKAVVTVAAELQLDNEKGFVVTSVEDETCSCETVICMHCGVKVDPESLLVVPCSKCGNLFSEEELDEDGCCVACKELEARGWSGLSVQDLMAKILELEQSKNSPKEAKNVAVKEEKTKNENTKKKPKVTEEPKKEEVVEKVEEVKSDEPLLKPLIDFENDSPDNFNSNSIEKEIVDFTTLDFDNMLSIDEIEL